MNREFHHFATPALGVLAGLLIGVPMLEVLPVLFLVSGVLGGVVGYRWRESRFFMYFAAVTVLVLAGLLMSYGAPSPAIDVGAGS